MSRKRFLFVLAITAIVLTGLGVALFSNGGSSRNSRTLPDGSVLTLRGITAGTKHRFVDGNLWQRVAGKLLPDAWATKVGATVLRYDSDSPTHFIWLDRRWSTNSPAGTVAGRQLVVKLTNNAGLDGRHLTPQRTRTREGNLHRGLLWALPTDSPTVRITVEPLPARLQSRLSVPDLWPPVSFDIANPCYLSRRRWRAVPYPIVVNQDELTLRLDRFESEPGYKSSRAYERMMNLSYEIRDRVTPANHWYVQGVEVFNEAGAGGWLQKSFSENERLQTDKPIMGALSTNTPWKLQFHLARLNYYSNEQFTFQAVPVPAAGGAVFKPLSGAFQGRTLIISNLTSLGNLTASISPPDSKWIFRLLRAIDQEGINLRFDLRSARSSEIFSWALGFSPFTTNVNLTFGLQRKRVIEVIAQPTAALAR